MLRTTASILLLLALFFVASNGAFAFVVVGNTRRSDHGAEAYSTTTTKLSSAQEEKESFQGTMVACTGPTCTKKRGKRTIALLKELAQKVSLWRLSIVFPNVPCVPWAQIWSYVKIVTMDRFIPWKTRSPPSLTNAVLAMPDQCEEVGKIVAVLIERMRECPKDVAFQSEACRLLRAVTSLSESVRARIVELGSVSVLMATLESNKAPDFRVTHSRHSTNLRLPTQHDEPEN